MMVWTRVAEVGLVRNYWILVFLKARTKSISGQRKSDGTDDSYF